MSTLQPERESTNTTSADHHPSTHSEPDDTQPLHSVPSTDAAPAHTPPSTPSSNPETSSTPLNNYNQLVERDSTESNGFTVHSNRFLHRRTPPDSCKLYRLAPPPSTMLIPTRMLVQRLTITSPISLPSMVILTTIKAQFPSTRCFSLL